MDDPVNVNLLKQKALARIMGLTSGYGYGVGTR